MRPSANACSASSGTAARNYDRIRRRAVESAGRPADRRRGGTRRELTVTRSAIRRGSTTPPTELVRDVFRSTSRPWRACLPRRSREARRAASSPPPPPPPPDGKNTTVIFETQIPAACSFGSRSNCDCGAGIHRAHVEAVAWPDLEQFRRFDGHQVCRPPGGPQNVAAVATVVPFTSVTRR
jgi:hypothetical protein